MGQLDGLDTAIRINKQYSFNPAEFLSAAVDRFFDESVVLGQAHLTGSHQQEDRDEKNDGTTWHCTQIEREFCDRCFSQSYRRLGKRERRVKHFPERAMCKKFPEFES